ncbi:hypothetical protein ACFL2V_16520 [Pseudomonadota bacterium]
MTTPDNKSFPIIAIFIFAIIIAFFIWVIPGSSNTPAQSAWVNTWKVEPSFHYPRRAPAAAAYKDFLYVVGGIDGNERYVHTVEYTAINNDGTLANWKTTSALNDGRFYNAVIAANGYLYAIGGGSGKPGNDNYPIDTVERAAIHADGSLGEWKIINSLITPRRGLKTVFYKNNIYAIGGYDGRFLKSTERATIRPDGSLTPWQMEKHDSIIDRYIHSATIVDKHVYLLGGHMKDPLQTSYSDVEFSHIQGNMHIGKWQFQTHSLQVPRLVAEAFSLNRYVYIAGGHTGNNRLTSVEMSRVNKNGELTPWKQTTPLLLPKSAYAVATYKNHVYLLGGAGEQRPLNNVHMASANIRGELGYNVSKKN